MSDLKPGDWCIWKPEIKILQPYGGIVYWADWTTLKINNTLRLFCKILLPYPIPKILYTDPPRFRSDFTSKFFTLRRNLYPLNDPDQKEETNEQNILRQCN